jgi:hypothetical protein
MFATLATEGDMLLLLSSIMDIFHGAMKWVSKTLVKHSCQEIVYLNYKAADIVCGGSHKLW